MESSYLCIILLIITITLYVSGIFPMSIVALLSAASLVVFKIVPASTAWAAFSSDTVLLIAGFLLIGASLLETGISEVIGEKVIKLAGGNPKLSIFLVLLVAGLFAMFMNSHTSVILMFLPIVASVIARSDGELSEQKYMQAFSVITGIGSLLTLIGAAPQMAVSGMLSAAGYRPFTFFQFTVITGPMFIVTMIYIFTIGDRLSDKIWGKNPPHSELMREYIAEQQIKREKIEVDPKSLRQKKRRMWASALILVFTVIGLLTMDYHGISSGTIGVLGGVACVLTKCLTIKQMYQKIDWGTIFLVSGSMGFAEGLTKSGGGRIMADFVIGLFGHPTPLTVFVIMTLLAIILTQLMSNTGCAAMLAPIGISLSMSLGVSPMAIVIGIVVGSSISFITPMASPPQAAIINWGGYKFSDFIKYSGILTIVLTAMLLIITPLIYPLI